MFSNEDLGVYKLDNIKIRISMKEMNFPWRYHFFKLYFRFPSEVFNNKKEEKIQEFS